MLIKNARWLTPTGAFGRGTIRIEQGRIAELNARSGAREGESVFDARGMLILPGAIDPHVHFREPGQIYKEGIANASRAALKGGVTTVLDMPNNKPPCSTATRLAEKKELFRKKCLVNWGLHFHASHRMEEDVAGQVKAVKIYMAKSSALPAITEPEELEHIFRSYPVISIHAEDETAFAHDLPPDAPHHVRRPVAAVSRALEKIEQALKRMESPQCPRVIICHMNTKVEVDWLTRMKNEGFDVWGETAPHYLYFTQEDYMAKGAFYQVNPPLRTEQDRQALLQALSDGRIDFIGTDHAPHSPEEKKSDVPPSGIAGIEWLTPLMLHLVDEGKLSWERLHRVLNAGAAECYAIENRSGIAPGNFADLVFVKEFRKPDLEEQVQTRVGVNLYESWTLNWRVMATMVNGEFKYRDGVFVSRTTGMEV
ncbi:MAG TPA: hypothetical protein ENJ89_08015 [Caldithrix abyssi]|uniref:Amidohydrolase-related domain-containing protein n=1 Tax=Caldithrix abyssi TaxID=187145 RepID=A0A7V5PQ09_CALAY|nr:hypothetical protein [Caldithrix abyssi]